MFLLLILAHVNTYLGKFQLDLKNRIKKSFCSWDLRIYIMNFFQHWYIGVYERQVCKSDMLHFMHWKSTTSLEKHSFTFGGHQQCVKVLPLSSHLLKLRNLFARLRLVCCFHWLHVIFLKNKAHTVLRNNVFLNGEWSFHILNIVFSNKWLVWLDCACRLHLWNLTKL